MSPSESPSAIAGKDYEKYHPGQVELTSRDKPWSGLLFTRYSHPRHCQGAPRPATSEHLLAFSDHGAVKGQYSFNQGAWKPYTWRQGEWLIGQAFANGRDSRWNTLCDDREELSVCYIHLSPALLERAAAESATKVPAAIELPHRMSVRDPLMYQLGLALKSEAISNRAFGTLYVESMAQLLAVHLLRHYCAFPAIVDDCRGLGKHPGILRAIDYIHSALDEDLSLEVLAGIANMSAYHFVRVFKQKVGMPPHQYLVRERMKEARRLLSTTDLPVGLIAMNVGYNTNNFSQVFKQMTGFTPSAYRRATCF